MEAALKSLRERVNRSGRSRALVAVYSTLGLLKFRLGALPEADAAARVALQVAQEGDFAPGLPFAATVLADVAVASGEFDEAQALLDLLPHGGLPAGVVISMGSCANGGGFLPLFLFRSARLRPHRAGRYLRARLSADRGGAALRRAPAAEENPPHRHNRTLIALHLRRRT